MTLLDLRKYCDEQIKAHPELRMEIINCYRMAVDECDEPWVSVTHECELAIQDIDDIINHCVSVGNKV